MQNPVGKELGPPRKNTLSDRFVIDVHLRIDAIFLIFELHIHFVTHFKQNVFAIIDGYLCSVKK